jgi:hypothetical protein
VAFYNVQDVINKTKTGSLNLFFFAELGGFCVREKTGWEKN